MSCSPALKWFIIVLLPLTFAWKLATRAGDVSEAAKDDPRTRVAEFFVRQNFAVAVTEGSIEWDPMLRATADSCRILVIKSDPTAWRHDAIRRHAMIGDSVVVLFRGKIYTEPPTWITVFDHLWSRFRRELGLTVQETPALAVIASATCHIDRLPWRELG